MTFRSSTFYCRSCADAGGHLAGLLVPSTARSAHQLSKEQKHTRPQTLSTGLHSVLVSGSTRDYQQLAERTFNEGFLEIEPRGTRALILQTTVQIGWRYKNRKPVIALDSFRWVLSTGATVAHGRPVSSTEYRNARCKLCGNVLMPS